MFVPLFLALCKSFVKLRVIVKFAINLGMSRPETGLHNCNPLWMVFLRHNVLQKCHWTGNLYLCQYNNINSYI